MPEQKAGVRWSTPPSELARAVERYGDRVNVYSIGEFSQEVCGGPHVEHTGQLGHFKIQKQESVGRGLRRIRAVLEAGG